MKTERLPLTIEPLKYAKAGRKSRGAIDLSEMPRLSEALHTTDGTADVSMAFDCDEEGRVVIDMSIKAILPLSCQRCLNVYELQIDSEQLLSPVLTPDEAERLPSHLEPFILTGDFLQPVDLIEESLLLEVPIVPMHDPEDCHGAPQAPVTEEVSVTPEKENPFAVLADLKVSLEQ